ncbi:hypothetical protein ACRAWF_29225 [Streptomyces sp. L7]
MTDSTPGTGRRDALLIATGRYDHRSFKALRSPGQDGARLAAVLADPRIGGFRTEQLINAGASGVMRAIEEFFRDRSRKDLLLLHISCHGIKDDEDGSSTSQRATPTANCLASTAVPASFPARADGPLPGQHRAPAGLLLQRGVPAGHEGRRPGARTRQTRRPRQGGTDRDQPYRVRLGGQTTQDRRTGTVPLHRRRSSRACPRAQRTATATAASQ